ncbi:MAG: hypothetical protein EON54_25310 [Alcaligenaceae bacterium]|nr:MAG: hypothetical protein EON54_25310 [Alcaligenaceae bacterium]
MTPEQLQAVATGIVQGLGAASWLAFLLIAVFTGMGAYLGSYLRKSSELKAINENFTEVREQLKKQASDAATIKHQFDQLLEGQRGEQQLRMVAADRRLQAHQEAFTLWRALYRATHTPEIDEV